MLVVRSSRPDGNWAVIPDGPWHAVPCRSLAVRRPDARVAHGRPCRLRGRSSVDRRPVDRGGTSTRSAPGRTATSMAPDAAGVAVDLDRLRWRRLQARRVAPEPQRPGVAHRHPIVGPQQVVGQARGCRRRRPSRRPRTGPAAPSSGRAGRRGRMTPGHQVADVGDHRDGRLELDEPAVDGDPDTARPRCPRPAGSPGTGTRTGRTGPCAQPAVVAIRRASKPMPQPMAQMVRSGGAPGSRSVGVQRHIAQVDGVAAARSRAPRWPPASPVGTPSTPPRMLPVPPGRMPSGTSVPASTAAMARWVPSPPRPTTDATPARAPAATCPATASAPSGRDHLGRDAVPTGQGARRSTAASLAAPPAARTRDAWGLTMTRLGGIVRSMARSYAERRTVPPRWRYSALPKPVADASAPCSTTAEAPRGALLAAIHERVDHGHDDQRQDRGAEQAADDHGAQLRRDDRALGEAERQRQQGQDGGHGRHQDGPHAGPATLDERVVGGVALVAQLFHEVQQHDGVGDHDADEHQEPDEGADADRLARDEQRREGADGRQRQAEQDDQRVDQRPEQEHHHEVDEQDRPRPSRGTGCRTPRSAAARRRPARPSRRPGWRRSPRAPSICGRDRLGHGALVVGHDVAADGRRGRAVDAGHRALRRPPG